MTSSAHRHYTVAPPSGRLVAAFGSCAVTCVLLAACSGTARTTESGTVKVVAGENVWGSIASQIGGSYVQVTSILTNPNGDPHLYESSAATAAAVAEASLVIRNGAGYDDWLTQLLGSTSHAGRIVVDVQDVLHMTRTGVNPHFWYDVPHVPAVAAAIESALVRLDPKHADAFEKNVTAFDHSLGPVDAAIAQIREHHYGAPVANTERVPGYLFHAAGLSDMTPVGFATAVEDGNDPSPADTLAMDQLLTRHQVAVLIYNSQTVSAVTEHVETLARSSGIPVVAVTETLPRSYSTFQAWQLAQIQMLLSALGRGGS